MGDPVDQLASPSPTPVPSPEGSNPLSPSAATSAIQVGSATAPAPVNQVLATPPAAFVAAVNNALNYRLGLAKTGLIPTADRTALVEKLWQDPTLSQYFTANQGNLKDPTIAGTLGIQIQNVMLGQGNDPTVAVDYTNMLQAAGVQLTTAEQASLAGATQAVNAPVPRPFDTSVVSGYDFGQTMPATVGGKVVNPFQAGTDYGTPAGSRIVSPFAGTVTVLAGAAAGDWGNLVSVTLDNGWKMSFGHVASGQAANGARVNPGDLIAISGANVGDSTGAVTEVMWQDPSGKYVNPHTVLDPIFAGTTFTNIGAAGAAGTGSPTVNKTLDAEYPSIKADWTTYFGSPPSPEDVYNVLSHGTSPAEWTDFIRSMPSHIDGMAMGQAYDLRQTADQVSTKVLGHPSTDGIVKELFDGQLSTPQAVTNWYNEHGTTGIDPSTYSAIVKAQTPIMTNIFNDPGADPRIIKSIYDTQTQQGTTSPAEARPVGSRAEAK